MSLDFTKLYIVAHQEAILNTIEWVNSVQNRVTTLIAQESNVSQANENKPETVRRRKTSSVSNASTFETHRKKLRTKSKLAAIVEDHLSETSKNLTLFIGSHRRIQLFSNRYLLIVSFEYPRYQRGKKTGCFDERDDRIENFASVGRHTNVHTDRFSTYR